MKQPHASKNNTIDSNPHLGAGLVGGSLNGVEQDEEGNLSFDPAKFAMGFLGGSLGSKAVGVGFKHLEKNPALKEKIITELADTLAQGFDKAKAKYPLLSMLEPRYIIQNERGRKIQAKAMLKELEKEQKGLYNVAYNGKNAVLIKKDLEAVDEAILFEKGTKRKGGKHIRLAHSQEPSQDGYVTKQEVANLGANIREYLKDYEPFIDTNGARLYEWEKEGVRFRVVVNDLQTSGGNSRLPSASEEIITFYSDRNLKKAMDFKNPALKETIIDVKKMQKAREKEHFYSTFDLQDVLDDTFIKRNNIENNYYGSIQIDPKLKEREYHISSNQLYLNKVDFNKNKISDEAIRDFLKSLRLLENNNNELWEAQNIAYKRNIPLSRAKKVMQEQKRFQKEIPLFKEASERFKEFEPRKIKDLLEWHKDSHPLTKDENGLPKVFYHGTGQKEFDPLQNKDVNFEVFKTTFSNQVDDFLKGHYFSSNIKIAKTYNNNNNIYKVFLNAKNPLVIDFKGHTFNDYIDEAIDNIPKSVQENIRDFYDSIIFKNIIDDSTQNGKKHPVADTIMVFNSNQIKHINNKGSYTDTKGNITKNKPKNSEAEHKYFNENSENIYYSNPHLGAGLVGGSLNGVEQDEEGNLSFDPAKFAMGFLGGTIGSKAVSKGIEWRANKIKKAYPNIAKDNPVLMEQIAKRDLLTYAKNESANALTRFLNKNKLFDSTRGLFAGEKALLNEAYAPQKARLAKAKELENKGADEIEIWEKTGWYKDKDDKWKFEISQRGGEFNYQSLKKQSDYYQQSLPLAEFLHDEKLYQAYPELMDLKILAAYDDGRLYKDIKGKYNSDYIFLNTKHLTSDEKAKSTLYHEIQHAIQDIEGFGFGEKIRDDKNYHLRHGEVEARNVEKRLRGAGKPYTKEDAKRGLEILNARLKRIEQEIQNVKNGVGEYKDETQETKDFILQNYHSDLRETLEDKEYILHLLRDKKIYNRTPHPYKTMDTPLKYTIADTTIQGEALSKELENYNPLAQVKEKVVRKISNYTKLRIFKSLSKDKQDAILSLKDIKPQPMPDTIAKENLENLFKHFENKQDKNARVYYSKLFSDTKKKPHLILETKGKQGQNRKEYVKVYQHKATHDLYYIVVTENNDKINITAHPITEIKELIRHIRNSERASVIKDSNQAPT